MSKSEKLIERFKNMPTNFTFDEMVKLFSQTASLKYYKRVCYEIGLLTVKG